ncbi:hypothetical protein B7463_g8668, partial [Scytalidium lignicola]
MVPLLFQLTYTSETRAIQGKSSPYDMIFHSDIWSCIWLHTPKLFTGSFTSDKPEKPPVPYKSGCLFTASRVVAPSPFLGRYDDVPKGLFEDFLNDARFPGRDYLKSTTLVDYCLRVSSKPLSCEPLEETATFEVLDELTVGDGLYRGCGPQVFTCKRNNDKEQILAAKMYDPLYYHFIDYDYPYIPNDVVARAEHDFALESAAYCQLDERLGGSLIPKFHGSWVLNVPLKRQKRPVAFILLEYVKGVPLSALDPDAYTQDERLNVLALFMEADLELRFVGVVHNDIAPRNVICPGKDLLAEDFCVRIINFDVATVFHIFDIKAPCISEALPESPVEWFWDF